MTPINSQGLPKVVCLFHKFGSKVPTQIPKQVLPNIYLFIYLSIIIIFKFIPIHLSIIFPYIQNIETCLFNCENLVSQICQTKFPTNVFQTLSPK